MGCFIGMFVIFSHPKLATHFIIQTSIFTKLFNEIHQIDEKMAAETDTSYSMVKTI